MKTTNCTIAQCTIPETLQYCHMIHPSNLLFFRLLGDISIVSTLNHCPNSGHRFVVDM